mmetsp:Transcript_25319/g.63487  ORF Transcript_25319/g.63487 Transcript_25319/m.63487 type:complete len:150 (-) Transcript_25319:44-493(-)
MRELNPGLMDSQKSDYRIKVPPPVVFREGTKKTVWANFSDICTILRRNHDHVLEYALAEMGTTGTLDAKKRLTVRGRFQPKQIQNVLRHYIGEYVVCKTCKSPETFLRKENRMNFLECRACGSVRSVGSIKSGYKAVIGKRRHKVNQQA